MNPTSETAARNGTHPQLELALPPSSVAPGPQTPEPDAMLKARGTVTLANNIQHWDAHQDPSREPAIQAYADPLKKIAEDKNQVVPYYGWQAMKEMAMAAELQRQEAVRMMAVVVKKAEEHFKAGQDVLKSRISDVATEIQRGQDVLAASAAAVGAALGQIGVVLSGPVSAKSVAVAAETKKPTPIGVAGKHGVRCPASGDGGGFVELLAKTAVILLLAICLGTLIGLAKTSDLRSPEGLQNLVIPALICTGLVLVLGGVALRAGALIARSLAVIGTDGVPRVVRKAWLVLAIPIVLLLFGAIVPAEVTTEAVGLFNVYNEIAQESNHYQDEPNTHDKGTGATASKSQVPVLPIQIFFLIACVVSFPYVLRSLIHGLDVGEDEVLRPWLAARLVEEEIAFYAKVAAATTAAAQYEEDARNLDELKAQRKALTGELSTLKVVIPEEAVNALKVSTETAAATTRIATRALDEVISRLDPGPPARRAPESKEKPKPKNRNLVGRFVDWATDRFRKPKASSVDSASTTAASAAAQAGNSGTQANGGTTQQPLG